MTERAATWLGTIVVVILITALAFPFAAQRCLLADNTGLACGVVMKLRYNPW